MTTLVIARRELAEKRFVFLTAAGLALVPFLGLLLPGAAREGARSFVASVGGVGATGFTLALALMLGSSAIGRDLSEKRLSFYFAKPVPAASIWFGKVAAAFVLIGSSFAIMIAPVVFFAGSSWGTSWNVSFGSLSLLAGGAALTLFVVGHAVSTMIRSRSALIAVDAVLAVATGFAASAIVRKVLVAGTTRVPMQLMLGLGAGAALALLAGGAWQLQRGGTDRLRNHIELSRFLWTSIAGLLLAAAAYTAWVVSATPADITRRVQLLRARSGPWLFAGGDAAHRQDYRVKFLINANDGTSYRYRPAGPWQLAAAFSADGRHAVYLGDVPATATQTQLYRLELEGKPEPVDTGISISSKSGALILSDDGSRVALIEQGLLRVIDLKSRRTIGAVSLGRGGDVRMFFATNDVVRIYGSQYSSDGPIQRKTMRIFEFDAPRHSLRETSLEPLIGHTIIPTVSPDGATMLLRMHDATTPGGTLILADARTGAAMSTIAIPRRADIFGATLIDGPRVAYITHEPNGNATLHFSGTDKIVDLGGQRTVRIVGEAAPGKLLLTASDAAPGEYWSRHPPTSVVVDVERGAIVRREQVAPWGDDLGYSVDPRHWSGSAHHTFLVNDPRRIFVTWNPLTGEKKPLLN